MITKRFWNNVHRYVVEVKILEIKTKKYFGARKSIGRYRRAKSDCGYYVCGRFNFERT